MDVHVTALWRPRHSDSAIINAHTQTRDKRRPTRNQLVFTPPTSHNTLLIEIRDLYTFARYTAANNKTQMVPSHYCSIRPIIVSNDQLGIFSEIHLSDCY